MGDKIKAGPFELSVTQSQWGPIPMPFNTEGIANWLSQKTFMQLGADLKSFLESNQLLKEHFPMERLQAFIGNPLELANQMLRLGNSKPESQYFDDTTDPPRHFLTVLLDEANQYKSVEQDRFDRSVGCAVALKDLPIRVLHTIARGLGMQGDVTSPVKRGEENDAINAIVSYAARHPATLAVLEQQIETQKTLGINR